MKILVLGASRGTGALCVKSALAKGHSVSAFSRTPAKLDVTRPALSELSYLSSRAGQNTRPAAMATARSRRKTRPGTRPRPVLPSTGSRLSI